MIDQLLEKGVDIRYLPRLHAKAIIADWDTAVVGSQNFTYYSQDSYEVSFLLDRYAEGGLGEVFFRLEEWWEEAGELLESDDWESEDED